MKKPRSPRFSTELMRLKRLTKVRSENLDKYVIADNVTAKEFLNRDDEVIAFTALAGGQYGQFYRLQERLKRVGGRTWYRVEPFVTEDSNPPPPPPPPVDPGPTDPPDTGGDGSEKPTVAAEDRFASHITVQDMYFDYKYIDDSGLDGGWDG